MSMFGSTVLEVCIGLALVYLLLSLVCSSINEFIGRVLSWRSTMLEAGVKTMLQELIGLGQVLASIELPRPLASRISSFIVKAARA